MNPENIKARRKLQAMTLAADFEHFLNLCCLSEENKEIMRMHYIQEKDFKCIGDFLGYSESAMKKRHSKILSKLNQVL